MVQVEPDLAALGRVGTGTGIRTPVPWLRIGRRDVDDDGAC